MGAADRGCGPQVSSYKFRCPPTLPDGMLRGTMDAAGRVGRGVVKHKTARYRFMHFNIVNMLPERTASLEDRT